MLPRERIEMLLDEGSYFLEIAPLAGISIDDDVGGAGVVGGIGRVSGLECLISASESTVKGGAISEMDGSRTGGRPTSLTITGSPASP